MTPDEQARKLIKSILSAYHTTRLQGDVVDHIMSLIGEDIKASLITDDIAESLNRLADLMD